MATASTSCRGFTHPVLLLIRSSLSPAARHGTAASQSPCLLRLSAASRRSSRLFTTSARRQQKPTTAGVAKTKVESLTRTPVASTSYAQALAQRPGGAILYEGAGQKIFIVSSYMAGLACLGGATFNIIFNVYNAPPGVPAWTGYAFGSVGLMLAILGMNFILKPSNIVRRIRVLPTPEKTAAAPKAGGYSAPAKIQIEVLSRKLSPIPGMPLKRTVVNPQDIVLKAKMYNPKPFGAPADSVMAREWAERTMARADYDKQHPATAGFRSVGWAFAGFFHSIRRGLTGEGFAPIEVNGQRLRLDISEGFVLDDGKAMDRILTVKEEERPGMLFRS
ncbi:hypothetical protein PFICI_03811 [Pestalotiopsis fici W106-1]|uniref:Uncharacterized protein n=1 Tax=Pestalotiopsis fici (strain W106-1 / CGMCC3.15140) TaxID=1229662 RepID=W3XKN8_PESFW|nr:uncharacterized protein PFICI_03811 [Pestalotiopsis fici W106-1]ETS85786.1 hypothetical protein PFICI_03811 [Pestalotiopsis fici W106-1]